MSDLRTARKEKRLCQEDLADLIGVKQSYITELENGKRWPQQRTREKLTSLLGEIDWHQTLVGPDRAHLMVALTEFLNLSEPGAKERIYFARQALNLIEETL